MKVLFTTNIPSPYRIDFFNELSNYCDLTVAIERKSATDRNREWTKSGENKFNRIDLKGLKVGKDTAFCPQIIKILKKNKFDLIVVGGYSTPTGMMLIKYLKKHKIPFLLNCDGGIIKDDNKIVYKIKQYFISSASGYLSTGKETDKYLKHYNAEEKIYRYPFTSIRKNDIIKTKIDSEEKEKLKKELGITSKNIIVAVGSFTYRKGFDILLNATKNIEGDTEIYIIGGKPTQEYIDIKEDLQIENVQFLDFMKKEDLEKYYKIADLFVLPTREDIWGLVINEAMAKGLPIVTTDKCVAGIELIENGLNGYIIPSNDKEALTKAINDIIKNKELSNIMSQNNLNKIEEYTIENMAKKHEEIFENFLQERMKK